MEPLKELTFEKHVKQARNLALRYLANRARSIKEMKTYLTKKNYSGLEIETTIDQLEQEKLLNDTEYAKMHVENRKRFNPRSRFALRYELFQKGIHSDDIDIALAEVDDYNFALRAVKSKLKLWTNLDKEKFKTKLINFLKNRGFDFDVCITTYHHIYESKNEK